MARSRIWMGALVLLVAVAVGLSACAEPVGYASAGYVDYGYPDGWLGLDYGSSWGHWGHRWDHGHHAAWGHGFAHGHSGFGGHPGVAGHGGFGGHGGGGVGGHGGRGHGR
jgi:hypothetical protein